MAEALRAGGTVDLPTISAVHREVIGAERGFLSQTLRVALDYAGPPRPGVPASVVVKIEPEQGNLRNAERDTKAFDREIRFYREVAGRVPMRLPRIYYTDAAAEGKVLIMEDLCAYQCIDQLHGLRHEQVIATVREVAKLHAAFWHADAMPDLGWIPLHDHFFEEGFEEHWPAFARSYELRIGREAVRLGERVGQHLRWIEQRISERPVTLIHSDLRADNLLFCPDQQRSEIIVLDWQLATRSLAAIDVCRLMGDSEPAAERRRHPLEVFTAWHEAMLRVGLSEYTLEEALTDFRLGALYCLFIPVKALALVGPDSGGRTGRLLDAISERLYASAIELDAGTLLP